MSDWRERPKQTNCQHEPPYPGRRTVLMSVRAPGFVAHAPGRCRKEYPHPTDQCVEFREQAK